MTRSLGASLIVFLVAGCAGGTDGGDGSDSAEAITAHSNNQIKDFECTAVASSATNDHLKTTRLDITADQASTGAPTGMLITGFESSLQAKTALGFGVSHVRDTTVSGHAVSEYKIDFGADGMVPGSTGGTLTIPTAYAKFALESSAALNVATLKLTPSNATVTYKCKKDTRKSDPGPPSDPLVFQGAAKDVVAKDSCAKDVASAVMDKLIEAIEDKGIDVPDTFTFTSIDRTATGFTMVVNGAKVPVVMNDGCSIKSIDTSAAGLIGE
jgi:hypothetical protein